MLTNKWYFLFFACCAWLGFASQSISHTVPTSVLSVALLVLWISYAVVLIREQWLKWLWVFLSLWLFAIVIEYVWVNSCLPYGCFEYTTSLWPMIGSIPVLLGFIRPIICLSTFSLTQIINLKIPKILLFIAILLTYDLALDPVNVANGLWSYVESGIRFGIPLSNFLGRVFSGIVSYRILLYLDFEKKSLFISVWAVCMMGIFWGSWLKLLI